MEENKEFEICERINLLRKNRNLSQAEFGAIVDVTKSTISLIESKKRLPAERLKRDICRELNVNPDWLENGTGGIDNMYISDEMKFYKDIGKLTNDKNDFKKFYIGMLMDLPDEYWNFVYNEFKKFEKEQDSD